MPREISVAIAGQSDRDDVVILLSRQLAEHEIRLPDASLRGAVDRVLADKRLGFLLVARHRVVPVGVAYVSFVWTLERGGLTAWLEELYVVPERRDGGIGLLMLTAVLERARERGCAAIDLEVDITHERAAHLYMREGFEQLERNRWVKFL